MLLKLKNHRLLNKRTLLKVKFHIKKKNHNKNLISNKKAKDAMDGEKDKIGKVMEVIRNLEDITGENNKEWNSFNKLLDRK